MPKRLHELHTAGQSLWLDYIDRVILKNGDLARRIAEDDLTGMTSNPSIFEKALAEGDAYDDQLSRLAPALSDREAFFELATTDVRDACDLFRGVYESTSGGDGFTSIEVSPDLAHDAAGTIAEAHRLWSTINRQNLMIKVPGTVAGADAIRTLTADGINVNVTLLFSIDAHARVIEAYLSGLESRVSRGLPIDNISSVASFFVSRVDTAVDKQLEAKAASYSVGSAERESALALRGKVAIANAKLAYRLFQASFSGARWNALAAHGARVQRPLWASTSTKNPAYRDVMYVENLIGPDTINTLPLPVIEAFRDHGVVKQTVTEGVADAEKVLSALESHGISLEKVTDGLLAEGLISFEHAFATLTAGLAAKRAALSAEK